MILLFVLVVTRSVSYEVAGPKTFFFSLNGLGSVELDLSSYSLFICDILGP